MKRSIVIFFCAASLLALTTGGNSRHAQRAHVSVDDTLPRTDTSRKDTFGEINDMKRNTLDSTWSNKKDSTSHMPPRK